MARLLMLAIMVTGLHLESSTIAIAEDYSLAGRVVVLRSNRPISGVLVEVKDQRDPTRVLTRAKTNESGTYKLTVSDEHEKLLLAYTPNNANEYGTHGRGLHNTLPDKTLDTVGLAHLQASLDHETHATAAVIGAADYVAAGGNPDTARAVLESASRNFSNFGSILAQNPDLRERLRRLGLPSEF